MKGRPDTSTSAPAASDLSVRFLRPELPPQKEIQQYLGLARDARWFSNNGPCGQLLTQRLSARIGQGVHCVPVASGTLGLMVALRALTEMSAPQANQVVLPSFTYIATLSAVVWAGLEPVFCDVDPHHWHMSPDQLEVAIRERASSLACLLPCSTFGTAPPRPVRTRWEELGAEAGVPVLVDSAAGFGSLDETGTELGAQGDAEVFSFHATKPLAVGEGGAVSTRDQRLADRIRQLSSFGLDQNRALAGGPGLNARMSDVHAAIALAALDRHDEVLRARRQRAATLIERLRNLLEFQPHSMESTWQFVPALAPGRSARDGILSRAREFGIEMRSYHQPLHHVPALSQHARSGPLGVTEDLASRILSMPMANDLGEHEIDRICSSVVEAES
jgi:dTDP-4-amino-4,6-dideoxygalactose transaminase